MSNKPIKKVAIIGGTHGNELTGIHLIKKYEQFPQLIQRSSFESLTLLANPKAVKARKRYIDRDLNRCFALGALSNPALSSYEDNRAKVINQILGPKGNPKINFIIDLHSTTANTGLMIIPSSKHPFNLRLAAYLSTVHPFVKVYYWPDSEQDSLFLRSICEWGCTIEVGPLSTGVLNSTLFEQTERLVFAILDYLEAYNQEKELPAPFELTLYQGVELVDYPRNHHKELQAMIHPELQYKDYTALNPGASMFLTFDGQALVYEGQSTVYPVFINEAAYYEKGIAMCLTEKHQLALAPPSF